MREIGTRRLVHLSTTQPSRHWASRVFVPIGQRAEKRRRPISCREAWDEFRHNSLWSNIMESPALILTLRRDFHLTEYMDMYFNFNDFNSISSERSTHHALALIVELWSHMFDIFNLRFSLKELISKREKLRFVQIFPLFSPWQKGTKTVRDIVSTTGDSILYSEYSFFLVPDLSMLSTCSKCVHVKNLYIFIFFPRSFMSNVANGRKERKPWVRVWRAKEKDY